MKCSCRKTNLGSVDFFRDIHGISIFQVKTAINKGAIV